MTRFALTAETGLLLTLDWSSLEPCPAKLYAQRARHTIRRTKYKDAEE
jgi:hypothetical protein